MLLLLFNYVQMMARAGCPDGYSTVYDSTDRAVNVKGCNAGSGCSPTSECMPSPILPHYVCCRDDVPVEEKPNFLGAHQFELRDPVEQHEFTAATVQYVMLPVAQSKVDHSLEPASVAEVQAVHKPEPVDKGAKNQNDTGNHTDPSGPGFSSSILISLPNATPRLPDVRPIIVGQYLPLAGRHNVIHRYGSVTLIKDSGYNILVDTSAGPRQNDVKARLASIGISPSQINVVILTHGHPDHFSNTHLFPMAQFVYGNYLYKGEEYLSYGMNQATIVKLTDNVDLWGTPGHTPDSVTVIVKNVPYGGVVAITGDLFISENDLDDPSIWSNLSSNVDAQQESRNFVICRANWIVPGHGKMFKVTNASRSAAGCADDTPEPTILIPQLPHHASFDEQNAMKYAYYAYAYPVQDAGPSGPIQDAVGGTSGDHVMKSALPASAYDPRPRSMLLPPSTHLVQAPVHLAQSHVYSQYDQQSFFGVNRVAQPQLFQKPPSTSVNGQCCYYAGSRKVPWQPAPAQYQMRYDVSAGYANGKT